MRPETLLAFATFVSSIGAFVTISIVPRIPSLLKESAEDVHNLTYGAEAHTDSSEDIRPEFAVLSPGSQIQLQVGNLDLARKAWKKRRRSGSPLLIPCSILNIDQKAMVINNLIFLLRKFGKPMTEQRMDQLPDGFKSHHIAITFPELSRCYKSHLRASLGQHANALGYDTATDLISDVITPQIEQDFGVKLWTIGKHAWIVAKISKMRGQRLASQSPLLQFIQGTNNMMMHTGMTRIKTDVGPGSYALEPMSAALRVSQRSIDTAVVSTGSIHQGSYIGIDPMGDGGSPLLKVSLNVPTLIHGRKRSRISLPQVDGRALELNLQQLKPGQGPFRGTVVHISGRAGAAFIDIGVGRTIQHQPNDGTGLTRVLGMLRFDELVRGMTSSSEAFTSETDDELDRIEDALNAMQYETGDGDEDIDSQSIDAMFFDYNVDDLFEEDDDDEGEAEEVVEDFNLVSLDNGQYTFRNPDTGEVILLGDLSAEDNQMRVDDGDGDGNDDDDDDEEDIMFTGLSPSQRLNKLSEIMDGNENDPKMDTSTLEIGDTLDVYIQAVSKQSGRFMVTTRSSGRSMKAFKQDMKSGKNLDRLLLHFDGDINKVMSMVGEEGNGIVKAISKVGDWLYVQPQFGNLPVGVAQLASSIQIETLSEGDSVRVRLDGVDETRGQLALTVVHKH